jgi:Zn-finger nucleic acid-binding protein
MAGATTCPECRGHFEQVNLKNIMIDKCSRCLGNWFDSGELTLFVEVVRPLTGFEGAPVTKMTCPRCPTAMLVEIKFPGTEQKLSACPKCKGTFLYKGQLDALHRELEPIVGKAGKSPLGDRAEEILKEIKISSEKPSCPICRGPFEETKRKGMMLDRCPACEAIWFDAGQLTTELEVSRKISLKTSRATELKCPRCPKSLLVEILYPRTDVLIEVCPDCRGSWLDEMTLADLKVAVGRSDNSTSSSGSFPAITPPAP